MGGKYRPSRPWNHQLAETNVRLATRIGHSITVVLHITRIWMKPEQKIQQCALGKPT